jgi:hypothetical protein
MEAKISIQDNTASSKLIERTLLEAFASIQDYASSGLLIRIKSIK